LKAAESEENCDFVASEESFFLREMERLSLASQQKGQNELAKPTASRKGTTLSTRAEILASTGVKDKTKTTGIADPAKSKAIELEEEPSLKKRNKS
jgi:hypothetical protein